MAVPTLLDFEGHLYPSLRREPSLTTAVGDALFGRHFKRRPVILSEIMRDEREYVDRHPVDWAVGAALVVSAACDRAVGAWDERFFLYSEETDYAARARALGFRVEYVPRARARHRGAGSGQSDALMALNAVNRVRYWEKHKRTARAMRAAVLLHELLRAASPGHRLALVAVSRRSSWDPLISSFKTRSAKVT
jgi:GT2 family glycosyltransferase